MKRRSSRFATLPFRDLVPVQMSYLRKSFELAPPSHLAEATASMTNKAMDQCAKDRNELRLRPGQLLVSNLKRPMVLLLSNSHWAEKLTEGVSLRAVRRQLEHLLLNQLRTSDPEATIPDL